MKVERKLTTLGLIVSTLIVLIEIYGGKIFHSYTLMVGGYYTLSVMAIEFIILIASVVRGRKGNPNEPFGFGKLEAAAGIFFGFILALIAIYIIIKSFYLNYTLTDVRIIPIVLYLCLFKYLKSVLEFKIAKKIQSQMLIASAHNSYYNALVTALVIVLIIISAFNKNSDLIGSLLISLFVLYKGIKVIIDNFTLINGQNDKSNAMIENIKIIVNKQKYFTYSNLNLTNVNKFYKVNVEVLIDKGLSISKLIKAESKLKRKIKKQKLNIKIVVFEFYTK